MVQLWTIRTLYLHQRASGRSQFLPNSMANSGPVVIVLALQTLIIHSGYHFIRLVNSDRPSISGCHILSVGSHDPPCSRGSRPPESGFRHTSFRVPVHGTFSDAKHLRSPNTAPARVHPTHPVSHLG